MDMEDLKEFVISLIMGTTPIGWPGDFVAVYETAGGMQYVVTYDTDYNILKVAYRGKILVF